MPNWKKLIVSGSDANLNSLDVTTDVTANKLIIKAASTYAAEHIMDSYNYVIQRNGSYGLSTFTINNGSNEKLLYLSGDAKLRTDSSSFISSKSIYAPHLGSFGFRTYGSTNAANVLELHDRTDNNNHGAKLVYQSSGTYSDGLVLDNDGKVGIGTTAPNTTLVVHGNSVAIQDGTKGIHVGKSYSDFGIFGASGVGSHYNPDKITLSAGNRNSGNSGYIDIYSRYGTTAGTRGDISIVAGVAATPLTSGSINFSTNNTQRAIIDFDGNVGIGTTSPGYPLEIAQTGYGLGVKNYITSTDVANSILAGYDSAAVYLGYGYGTKEVHIGSLNSGDVKIRTSGDTIIENGNVGIGTTSPSTALHIKSTAAGGGYATIENTVHLAKLQLKSATHTSSLVMDGTGGYISGGGLILDSGTHPKTQFLQGGVSKMIINNGNVGIGTTSPSEKLEVDGNARITGDVTLSNGNALRWTSDDVRIEGTTAGDNIKFYVANTEILQLAQSGTLATITGNLTTTGNVGIGTTSPSQKLEVDGNIKADSFIKDGGTSSQFLKADGSVDSSTYLVSNDLSGYLLNTTDTLTGDLTVTGKITAQEFHTEFVSASIMYDSGSTKFGDTSDDNHDFTGSLNTKGAVNISGSLNFIGNGIGSLTAGDGLDEISLNVADVNDGGNPDNFTLSLDGNGQGTFYAKLLELGDGEGVENGTNITIDSTNSKILLANGNVGIGTTTPSYPFVVKRTGSNVVASFEGDENTYLRIARTGTQSGEAQLRVTNNGNFSITSDSNISLKTGGVSGTTRLYVRNNDGNVGIGTTAPTAKLQIDSTSGWGVFTERGIKDGSTSTYSHSFSAGNAHVLGRSTIFESSVTFSTLTATSTTKEYRFLNSSDKLIAASVVGGVTTDNNILVLSGANVGIGTTSPSEKLEVAGQYGNTTLSGHAIGFTRAAGNYLWAKTSGGDLRFTVNGNPIGSASMIINSSGNVGIGTTTPLELLHLESTEPLLRFDDTNSGLHYIVGQDGDGFKFTTNNSTYGKYTFDSKVGIGTTSPGAKLDIVGDTSSDYAPLTSVSLTGETASGTGWAGTDVLTGYTHTAGNSAALVTTIVPSANTKYKVTYTVSGITAGRFDFINFGGIPYSVYTSSNQTKTIYFITENTDPLEIVAQSGTAGTITIDSIAVIGIRDSVINIRNSSNTIVNQISTGASANSVYIGNEAGQSLPGTTTLANTALGSRALKNNLNGGYNTAIGYHNIRDSFASSYITAVGHNIFPHLTKVGNVYNTAIGTNIGTSTAMAGSLNILLGNNMFMSATTATGNIAMGYNAMRNATTASKNIALGTSSLFSVLTGVGNIALGEYSLTNKTGGNYDLALGHLAGRYAGSSLSANTNSGNSIFLGYRSRPNNISETNQIVIGHDAIGNGSNSVTLGATTITKTILNGNVGIGTTSPSEKLDVAGNAIVRGGIVSRDTYPSVYVDHSGTVMGGIRADATNKLELKTLTTAPLSFQVNSSEKMRILDNGNVGIGTTSPSKKLTVEGDISGSGDFYIDGAIFDTSNVSGTSGQVLSSTATGTAWIDTDAFSSTSSEAVLIAVKNTSGGTITEGTPVYETGTVGATETLTVSPADASDSTKMPAIGILTSALNDNGQGYAIVTGIHKGITTSPIDGVTPTTNTTLYVKAGGGLTTVKPTGATNLIQNVGKVGKVSGGSAGSIVVSSIMRSNDIPNLPEGKVWVGSSNYTVTSSLVHLDESNERMGIGTVSPSSKLEVISNDNVGTTKIISAYSLSESQSTSLGYNSIMGSYSLDVKTLSTQPIRFSPNSSEAMRITSDGKVGIGTTNPSANLDIEDASGVTIDINSSTGDGQFRFQDNGITKWSVGRDNTQQNFVFSNSSGLSSDNVLTLAHSTGNVGIGTTSPNAAFKLDVIGNISASNNLYIGNADDLVTPTTILALNSGRVRGVTLANLINTSGGPYLPLTGGTLTGGLTGTSGFFSENVSIQGTGNLTIRNTTSTGSGIIFLDTTWQAGIEHQGGKLFFRTGGQTDRMVINGSGNVGIGTTSPSNKLDVNGTAYVTDLRIGSNASGEGIIRHYSTGGQGIGITTGALGSSGIGLYVSHGSNNRNVGIGTTSPSTKLEIADTTPTLRLTDTRNLNVGDWDDVSLGKIQFHTSDTTSPGARTLAEIEAYSSVDAASGPEAELRFKTSTITNSSAQTRMIIDASGNVGIGTTTPSRILSVKTSSSSMVADFRSASGNNSFISFSNNASTADQVRLGSTSGNLVLSTNYTERIRIDASGKVGIGTTSPSQKLDVAGSIRTNNQLSVYNTDLSKQTLRIKSEATTNSGLFKLSNGSNWGLLMKGHSNSPFIGAYYNGILNITGFEDSEGTTPSTINLAKFYFGGTGGGSGYLVLNGDLKVNNNKKLQFGYANTQTNGIEWVNSSKISAAITPVDTANFARTGLGFFTGDFSDGTTNADERMRITRTGNVGIGTTSPTRTLDVRGGAIIAGDTPANAVGGTLEIYKNGADSILTIHEDAGTHNARIRFRAGGNDTYIQNTPGYFEIRTEGNLSSGNSPLKITSSGDVTLGYDLTVAGKITAQEFHTEFVSASIMYESGSTKFGDTSDDNHDFTGSLEVRMTDSAGDGKRSFIASGSSGVRLQRKGDSNGWAMEYGFNANDGTNLRGFGGYGTGNSYLQYHYIGGTFNNPNVTVLAGGNVGIGTTSPGQKLDVRDGTITSRDSGNVNYAELDRFAGLTLKGNGAGAKYVSTPNTDALGFKTNNSERMRIDSSGNVGIGTTAPAYKLDVAGTIRVGSGGAIQPLLSRDSATGGLVVSSVGNSGDFIFKGTGNSEKFRITDNGNVGIGTTSPAAGLQVALGGTTIPVAGASTASAVFGNSTSDDNYGLAVGANSSGVGYISSQRTDGTSTTYNLAIQPNGGNVGIGTDSPGHKLSVKSGTTPLHLNRTGGATALIGLDIAGVNRGLIGATTTAAFVSYSTAAASLMTILNTGNVGIGTTTPNHKLSVAGGNIEVNNGGATWFGSDATGGFARTFNGNSFRFISSANSETMRINNATGNVGIGTTSPGFKLEVESTSVSVARFKSTGTKAIIYLSEADEGGLISTEANRLCFGSAAGVSAANINYHMGTERLGIGTASPTAKLDIEGDLQVKGVNISNQENLDVDTGTETIATVAKATYDAAFFDFVIKNGTNLRAGTVFAIHDGTNVEFTETSTNDLGDTSDVTLSVDISGTDMRLRATTTTDNWIIKSLVRTI